MEASLNAFLAVVICLEVISLLCSGLLVYCSLKVQPINKPPGSLVLIEMIFISLVQLLTVIYTIFNSLAVMNSSSTTYGIMLTAQCIAIYCVVANVNYEICILIELNIRLKVKKSSKSYHKRSKLYHLVTNIIAFLFAVITVVGFLTLHPGDEYIILNTNDWLFWFAFIFNFTQLLIFIGITVLTTYKNSKLPNNNTKRFISKVIKYMIILVIIRTFSLIILGLTASLYKTLDSEDYSRWTVYSVMTFYIVSNIAIYALRLKDPYIVQFLKYKIRGIKLRLKDKIIGWQNRRDNMTVLTVNQSFLPIRKLFDEILIEKIEYQLIALSIVMLKSQESYEEIKEGYKYYLFRDEIYNQKTETAEINSNDLYILNCPDTQSKCKIQTDFNYRCEYKQYAPDVFQDILTKESVNLNDIANSLFIEDNRDSIKKFISPEDNKENYFITYDEKYILKTLSKEEHKHFLKHTLKLYHQRIIEDSFLQRIYGLYKLTYNGEYLRVMIIKNSDMKLYQTVEAKRLSKSIKFINNLDGFQSFSKDLEAQDFKLTFPQDEKINFFNIIEKDLDFLKTLHILNFSILLIAQESSQQDLLIFHAEIHKKLIPLSIVITHFITSKPSKISKKSSQIPTTHSDFDDDIKTSLSILII